MADILMAWLPAALQAAVQDLCLIFTLHLARGFATQLPTGDWILLKGHVNCSEAVNDLSPTPFVAGVVADRACLLASFLQRASTFVRSPDRG